MDLFLDTCVIIGYHTDIDPQYPVVNGFLNANGINLDENVTTCEKVRNEVNVVKRRIRRRYKEEKKLTIEEINNKIQQIDQYLDNNVIIVDYSDYKNPVYANLYAYISDDMEIAKNKFGKSANVDDAEVLSNSVIWALEDQIGHPVFLTTDENDYNLCDEDGNCVPLISIKKCMSKLKKDFEIPFELLVLTKSGDISHSLNK
ncbi:hypothetical protein [Methanococcus maripaludis]|uniref:Nucleic acid-binding protein n=1 Tax=Methanococcus maripaludis TaxID=39152 RepID=A0A7J9PT28_METMI|nr:hypothetical protein [Methanococcus maripaludis]MBA2868879.1 hypothetical protein [Methanococcus maripaludis]